MKFILLCFKFEQVFKNHLLGISTHVENNETSKEKEKDRNEDNEDLPPISSVLHTNCILLCRVYHQLVWHIYFRDENSLRQILDKRTELQKFYKNADCEKTEKSVHEDLKILLKNDILENPVNLVKDLCAFIYSFSDEKNKLRALLCEIYFLSKNRRYSEARLLFNRTNIHELISLIKDEQLKGLYNRTLIQLGLAAFYHGDFESSKEYLGALCTLGTSRLRDNLFQPNEKLPNLDREEKKRLVPCVMAINIEEIEAAFYLVSLELDLPEILQSRLEIKEFSSYFKRQMDSFEKQVIVFKLRSFTGLQNAASIQSSQQLRSSCTGTMPKQRNSCLGI